ncbi:MAG: acetyl-CoA carboxylase biotin carboxylase subunit [Anaerolineae bacterium]|jgi:acetyl-CoA carboxylase biotin carboxylase subunit|nr:acetyl-CoA carboxylase biotin carboxylase subunit [Anaerolineae bacterium]
MLKKCLIANRGEIAVRIIRACRGLGIATVAVYSDVDARAKHVRLADEAVRVGEASPASSYLRTDRLIEAAQQTGTDCIHPGYGFLSENAAFAQAVIDAGLVWVGPPPSAIQAMGVKTEARSLMEAAGVPLVPGFQSAEADDDRFVQEAARIGYPVMVKAAGGGGGKGIRIVRAETDLLPALESARREAQKAFNDPRVFLERYIERGRHIEVQVLADQHGNTVHLFERECSAQRRHQKVIEESPSPLLTDEQRAAIGKAGVDAARAVGYVNAGTVEFIATPSGEFFFLEMNTRLQVEHPVTELVTGLDLVQLQLRVASGEPLPFSQADLTQCGHAVECRVYAEDPANGFLPAIGPVLRFIPPEGVGVRVDSGIQTGDEVTIHYDPMVAKVITYGATRTDALERMRGALRQTVVQGVTTNIPFLLRLLDHPATVSGELDTTFIDQNLADLLPARPPLDDAAAIALALSEPSRLAQAVGGSISADPSTDPYNPWARPDGFRLSSQGN